MEENKMETKVKSLEEVLDERKPKRISFERLSEFNRDSYNEGFTEPNNGSQEDLLKKTEAKLYELCQKRGYQVVDNDADLIIAYHHCPCCMTAEAEGLFLQAAYIHGKENVLILFPTSPEVIERNVISRIGSCWKSPEYLLPAAVSF